MLRRTLAAATLAALPGIALAHHGWGSFDRQQALDATGEVVSSSFGNPHGTVVLRHEGETLTFELAPVSRLRARGLEARDIAPGQRVRLFAYRNAQDRSILRAEWIEAGGKRVELR